MAGSNNVLGLGIWAAVDHAIGQEDCRNRAYVFSIAHSSQISTKETSTGLDLGEV
jgi:hypothetical protein